jgi:hypothetical protein
MVNFSAYFLGNYNNNFILHVFYLLMQKVNQMEGYCVKCKAKREMKDEKQVTMKNGRPATQGICTVCNTKMFKIGGSKK